MALELIAAIVAAIVCASIAFALRRLSGGRLPKWIITAAGGAGLIGFTVWSEYDWFNRVSAELPAGVKVVWQSEAAMPLRPWTFLFPITTKFVAMDVAKIASHPNNPDLRLARLYNFGRWQTVKDALMVIDCAGGRQVLVTEGVEVTPDGLLQGADWVVPAADDGFQTAACVTG